MKQYSILLVAALSLIVFRCGAQGTAFTYQGRLTDAGTPANGMYDLQFNLYDLVGGGSSAGTNGVNDIFITNGLFTVLLDFGPGVFTGSSRFLEIGVRPGASVGAYTSVVPRQMITTAPYAITAGNVTGTVSATQLSGTIGSANMSGVYGNAVTFSNAANSFGGSGVGLTALNASELASGLVPDARLAGNVARTDRVWLLGGNSGTTPATHFLGTSDAQALELRVNSARALRLEPTTNNSMVNVIGGSSGNYVDSGVVGATIAGGGTLNYFGTRDTNRVAANFGAIGGGGDNFIASGADYSVIGGGNHNGIRGDAYGSIVAGGIYNTIETNADGGIIGGGSANTIQANAAYSTIAGGAGNFIQTGAVHAAIGGGFNNTNGGAQAFIGGGYQNFAGGLRAVIGGGYQNVATNFETTIGGGVNNFAGGWESTIGGGALNTASGDYSFVGAGFQNQATTNFATVPGGQGNRAAGRYSLAAGHQARADHEGAFVWADSPAGGFSSTTSNQFSIRANGGVRMVTGGAGMTLDGQPVLSGTSTITSNQLADGAVIVGKIADGAVGTAQISDGTIRSGDLNLLSFATTFWKADGNSGTSAGTHFIGTTDSQPLEFKVNNARALRLELNGGAPTLVGGFSGNSSGGFVGGTIAGGGTSGATNKLGGNWATVGGGYDNRAMGFYATVVGGRENLATNFYALVAGGFQNTANGQGASVGGGENNSANGQGATVGGGDNNSANRTGSTIAGGSTNSVNSINAVIAGGRANTIETFADNSGIGGGFANTISSFASESTIGGGKWNTIWNGAFDSTIGGGWGNAIHDSSYLSTIGGGYSNSIAANTLDATIAGGEVNNIGTNSNYSMIGGGYDNRIGPNSPGATIAGGYGHDIGTNAGYSAISGGNYNHIAEYSRFATIGGGLFNSIGTNADYSAIGGGNQNTIAANAQFAMIPGGQDSAASGNYSFAAGRHAKANHAGSFVWADASTFDFSSTVPNGFFARSVGGVKFVTGIDGFGNETAGVRVVGGASAWSTLSDRAVKKNIEPVDYRSVLDKLAHVPISRWNYKWEKDGDVPNLGPMAQDFKAAFYPGRDDKSISTLEFDGVELAAIQGLNQKVEQQRAENAELRRELAELKKLVQQLTQSSNQ